MHKHIEVDINRQLLTLYVQYSICKQYLVSTAKNGINNQQNTGGTPIGRHIIRAKIGANQPINSIFVGRRPTGEIFNQKLAQHYPERDWILSRILWLSGCEIGVNRLNNCDTMRRYIYIHGTPDHYPMGIALSHGCIRMRNHDVIELFDMVDVGTPILLHA